MGCRVADAWDVSVLVGGGVPGLVWRALVGAGWVGVRLVAGLS